MPEAIKSEVWECWMCGGQAAPCRVEIKYTDDQLPVHLRGRPLFKKQRVCVTDNERHADFHMISRDGIEQEMPTRRIVLEDAP